MSEVVRLAYNEKVSVAAMKEVLQFCLQEHLNTSTVYDGDKCNQLSKTLSVAVRNKLKGLNYDRYKYIVTVLVGERREQGIKMGTRCFWDSGTDNQVTETFMNDSVFCTITAYAIYLI